MLKHLRYAPIAASLFSIFIVTAFDFGMIELSKWRINRYVYQNSALIEKPDFDLHNDYRGWCGNGYFANTSYLYYETASTELNNRNSAIRARALLATDKVADIFNGTDRERFRAVLKNACQDSSEEVRSVAEEF